MKAIYLAGPIHGCTDEEATQWRQWVRRELDGAYDFLDPMDRDYRGAEDQHVSEIVTGDIGGLALSDVVLVHAERASWGTAMEVWIAHRELPRRPRILVVCPDPVSPWLRFCADEVFPTLAAAVEYLRGAA